MNVSASCLLCLAILAASLAFCQRAASQPRDGLTSAEPSDSRSAEKHLCDELLSIGEGPDRGDYPHLQQLIQLTQRIYSGGEPHVEQSFAELKRLGVRTIVSVDGAQPRVDTAKKYGLAYVHIPIGYDGIHSHAGLSIAKLMRTGEAPGILVSSRSRTDREDFVAHAPRRIADRPHPGSAR